MARWHGRLQSYWSYINGTQYIYRMIYTDDVVGGIGYVYGICRSYLAPPRCEGTGKNRRLWAQKWNEVRRSQGCDEEKIVNIYQRRYFRSGRSFSFRGNILFIRFTAHHHFILICRLPKMCTKSWTKNKKNRTNGCWFSFLHQRVTRCGEKMACSVYVWVLGMLFVGVYLALWGCMPLNDAIQIIMLIQIHHLVSERCGLR